MTCFGITVAAITAIILLVFTLLALGHIYYKLERMHTIAHIIARDVDRTSDDLEEQQQQQQEQQTADPVEKHLQQPEVHEVHEVRKVPEVPEVHEVRKVPEVHEVHASQENQMENLELEWTCV